MNTIELKVKFATADPLTPADALRMREIASWFCAVAGKATYQLKTRGTAESLSDAVEGLFAQIRERCPTTSRRFADGSTVKFLSISAETKP